MTNETDIADLKTRVAALEKKVGITAPTTTPTQPTPTQPAQAGGAKPPNVTAPAAEPTGTNLTSVSKLAGATLNKKMDALTAGYGVTFPAIVISDPDMNYPPNYAVYTYYLAKPTSLQGSGVDKTILEIKPNSLTQSYVKIDSLIEPAPCPYRLIRVDKAALIQDLTLRGTNQGTSALLKLPYSFHGLQFFATANPTLRRVRLTDISGSKGVPPNETFSVEGYKVTGTFTVEDVIIDGPNLAGSSGITVNAAADDLAVVIKRVSMKGHPNGSGWTTFNQKLKSFRAEDYRIEGALCGFNFEHCNVNGGSKVHNEKDSGIVLVRPDISKYVKPEWYTHLGIDGSAAGGGVSNRVDIHDPVGVSTSNPFGVTISAGYGYATVPKGAQTQRGADIHLWVGETERPDLLKFIRTTGAA